MAFNTLNYFIFLPAVFLLHYFTPDRFRWLVLLLGSFVFYLALGAPHLIVVLLLVTTTTYYAAIWIHRKQNSQTKQYLLWGGISLNLFTLVILKYLPFLTTNINFLFSTFSLEVSVPLTKPLIAIGASYFIFQAISYLIDVYLELEKPEWHYGHFALYMSFFPKLLQGPIERGCDLLPQFKIPYVFNYDTVRSGMLLFAIGLLKKVVIADRLAYLVNPVFDNVHAFKDFQLLVATYYYSLQIYFDFSGYTDMALGAAMLFNIRLTQNFNSPYAATSIADFWRRWHISFSRWILDYIFKPLQMSWRNWGTYGITLALVITFTISGVWHGARWGFILWGFLHGLYMAVSIIYRPYQKKIYSYFQINNKSYLIKLWQRIFVFNLVAFAWIFFRCESIQDGFFIVNNIISCLTEIKLKTTSSDFTKLMSLGKSGFDILYVYLFLVISIFVTNKYHKIASSNFTTRWLFYSGLVMSIIIFGFHGKSADFLYFKF